MKRLTTTILAMCLLLGASSAFAYALPFLDFGSSFQWDGTNYTSNGSVVNSVTYMDGTVVNNPGADMVLGMSASLNLSFDGVANDTLYLTDGTDAVGFAVLEVTPFDPVLATPNPYITIVPAGAATPGMAASQWFNEFVAAFVSGNNTAELRLSFLGSLYNAAEGVWDVNGNGKIAGAPEPATLAMLGFALLAVGGMSLARRRNNRF